MSIPLIAKAVTVAWFSLDNQYVAASFSQINEAPKTSFIVDNAYILPQPVFPWKIPPPKPPFKVLGESAYPTTKRIFLPGDVNPRTAGQCAIWANYHAGTNYSGNAIEWKKYINSETPEPGDIIVLSLSYWGHVGIVLSVQDGQVTYRSRNQDGLWVVSDNTIPTDSQDILGYIRTE